MSLEKRHNLTGWAFLAPATIMIAIMSFWPMIQALILSFQTGKANNLEFGGLTNYIRMFKDKVFMTSLGNTFLYLIIQVPIMLVLALMLAQMLNNKDLRGKGIFRTAIFLPCATSLVSYAIIFRSLFGVDGFINSVLINLGILDKGYNFLGNAFSAKVVIIIALIWRWTGYNMVFYLAGLQNIEYSVYEAAKIDGASPMQTFFKITVPLLKPTIVMTAIMSTNGTLQLFDESVNLTKGGPGQTTLTMSHYIYDTVFKFVPTFGYASAMSFLIFIIVAILAFRVLMYIVLTIVSLISVFPLYWMLMASTNKSVDVSRGRMLPGTNFIENWKALFAQQNVKLAMFNSFKFAVILTLCALVICSLAGYGFEIYHDKHKDFVFSILLLGMMVPFVATMIPLFRMFTAVNLQNTTLGFILPTISTPFLIMMFRQNARAFPIDIIEAARIDGLNEVQIFFRMFVPTMKSTYAAAMTITFMNAWNNYLWPKVIMQGEDSLTMPMLVANLTEGYVTDYGVLMLAVLLCSLPTVIIFFLLQKSFAEGITGAVK